MGLVAKDENIKYIMTLKIPRVEPAETHSNQSKHKTPLTIPTLHLQGFSTNAPASVLCGTAPSPLPM